MALGKARAKQYSLLKAFEKGGIGAEGCMLGDKVCYACVRVSIYEAMLACKGDVRTTSWGCKLHGPGCDHGDTWIKYASFGSVSHMFDHSPVGNLPHYTSGGSVHIVVEYVSLYISVFEYFSHTCEYAVTSAYSIVRSISA